MATPVQGEEATRGMPTPTITPVLVAHLVAEGELMPVYVHVIDHPDGRVLVDTGMTELHEAVADMDPRLVPLSEQAVRGHHRDGLEPPFGDTTPASSSLARR